MPRWAARTDKTHKPIVDALRHIGCSAVSLAAVGKGCPDILVATPSGVTLCMEVKSPGGQRKRGKTQARTDAAQADWHENWKGLVAVVESVEEATAIVWAL